MQTSGKQMYFYSFFSLKGWCLTNEKVLKSTEMEYFSLDRFRDKFTRIKFLHIYMCIQTFDRQIQRLLGDPADLHVYVDSNHKCLCGFVMNLCISSLKALIHSLRLLCLHQTNYKYTHHYIMSFKSSQEPWCCVNALKRTSNGKR